jgi:phage regulator Rha-like protein
MALHIRLTHPFRVATILQTAGKGFVAPRRRLRSQFVISSLGKADGKIMDREQAALISVERIGSKILIIRGQKVMLDMDLADLYGVQTKRLNEQVKRNRERFPKDFMFQLTLKEWTALRSQFATSNAARGGRRYLPFVFTEHGAVMLANVLSSSRAIQASIQVVRAFAQLRQLLVAHEDLARKLAALEKKYDGQFRVVFEAIRQLMSPLKPPKPRRIGFHVGDETE